MERARRATSTPTSRHSAGLLLLLLLQVVDNFVTNGAPLTPTRVTELPAVQWKELAGFAAGGARLPLASDTDNDNDNVGAQLRTALSTQGAVAVCGVPGLASARQEALGKLAS